jgi:hypothetical protein
VMWLVPAWLGLAPMDEDWCDRYLGSFCFLLDRMVGWIFVVVTGWVCGCFGGGALGCAEDCPSCCGSLVVAWWWVWVAAVQ